ncbi:MAG TPA: pilus assembly protein N-terminal domain-containing protein [Tepidisphaeraceae bacterium]|jgi:pilus assembly protein CpaC
MIVMNHKKNQNRHTRRTVGKALATISACALSVLTVASPAFGQQTVSPSTTQPAAQTAPSGRTSLVTDGIGRDGKIRLVMNKTSVLTTARPYKSVSIGQPDVADVTAVSPTNILLTAKKPGTTQVIVWDDQNRTQVMDVNVAMDLDALSTQLTTMFPGTNIEVTALSGSIALRGKVPDVTVAEQAVSAASAYGVKVLNFLEVGGGQQVMLQVRFAEVSRTATSQLGVNFAMSDGIFSVGNNVGSVTPSGFTDGGPGSMATQSVGSGVTLFGSGQAGSVAFRYFVQALRQNNLLRVLAEPNLIAMSGQEASFLAGGEFPVPVPQSGTGGAATITIDYREFGVRLGFVPVVLGDGRIRLKMTPEVSDLDFSSPIVISGSRIPVVNKRKVTTMVELCDGQTFAIAGLLNNNVAAAKDVTPLLGDLPVLGTLFRSVRYQRKETELVVLVTPKLVAPMNPGKVAKLPGESWRHPSEGQLFLNQDLGGEEEVPVEKVDEEHTADAGETGAATNAVAFAPATQPAVAGAATTRPAIAGAATTQPTVAAVPTTRPAVAAAPSTQPAVAVAQATQPAVAKAPTAEIKSGRAGSTSEPRKTITVMPAMASNSPRYHGRHGFTPPSHAPARGPQ